MVFAKMFKSARRSTPTPVLPPKLEPIAEFDELTAQKQAGAPFKDHEVDHKKANNHQPKEYGNAIGYGQLLNLAQRKPVLPDIEAG